MKDFYYKEMQRAKKNHDYEYADICREMYRELVMDELKAPYVFIDNRLKQFPVINLN